jgi:6-phosphogluconolactonase
VPPSRSSPETAGQLVVVEPDAFAPTAARHIAERIRLALAQQPRCALALAGGTTPRPVYRQLVQELEPRYWGRVEVFFGDERCVPPSDPDSNYRMARETLLDGLPSAPAAVHRMQGEDPDREAAARRYAALLPRRLDLLLLGLGPDGHTASLFPGAATLSDTRLVAPADAPWPPRRRLTITPSVIRAAGSVVILVAGPAKAEVLRRVLEGPVDLEALPAQAARRGIWMVDREAAAALEDHS